MADARCAACYCFAGRPFFLGDAGGGGALAGFGGLSLGAERLAKLRFGAQGTWCGVGGCWKQQGGRGPTECLF